MGNANIAYIDYIESYLDILNSNFPKWFRKIVYKILNYFGYIRVSNNYYVLMCEDGKDINERFIKRLIRKIKYSNFKNIVLAEELYKSEEILARLRKDFNILDGKWLYKFLILEIIQKISVVQNKKIDEYEVTVLCDNPTEIVFENIKELSKRCKIVNVLTINSVDKFNNIEKELYEKNGLILNISTNTEKVCLFSDIIVNIDFDKNMLKRCCFRDNSILIQVTKEKFERNFMAVIIFYNLSFAKTYTTFFNKMNHFDEEILYESLLYYSISLEGMRRFFDRDNVKVKSFEGLHGKIKYKELKTG